MGVVSGSPPATAKPRRRLNEPGIGRGVDCGAGCAPVCIQAERRQRRFDILARQAAGNEHDAGAAVGRRP
jgi:hypothetical protein